MLIKCFSLVVFYLVINLYCYRNYVLQHFRGFKMFLLALTAYSGQVIRIKITHIKHIFIYLNILYIEKVFTNLRENFF